MNEEELIRNLKEGNETSFHALVDAYQTRVLKICFRFFLIKEDAEDIAQWVFIEIFQSIGKFKGDCSLSTWVYRITISKCLDEIKKRKRKKRITVSGGTLPLEHINDAPLKDRRPDEKIEDKEIVKRLLKILDNLPENQRAALALSKIEGYNHLEIAEIMNISTSAVDSLIFRAKRNLQNDINSDVTFKK